MKYYNIYYKGSKINNRPLSEEMVESLYNEKSIYKKNILTNKLDSINIDKLKFVETIII